MQSSAISISPSIPLLKPLQNPNFRHHNLPLLRPSLSSTSRCSSVVNRASNGGNTSRRSSQFDGLTSLPSLRFSGKRSADEFAVSATSVPENADSGDVAAPSVLKTADEIAVNSNSVPESADSGDVVAPKPISAKKPADEFAVKATPVPESADSGGVVAPKAISQTLELGIYFGLWYLLNIYFNIYNKQVLKVYQYPMTVTVMQFAVGSVLVIFMWMFNLYKKPKVTGAQLASIVPLALVHTLGNLFTNMSLGKVAVSFTHTIKAMEPFFSVLLSVAFLGEKPTIWVLLALLPIVGGVALASVSEASFNWAGFWSAMASNLSNQSRNVLSKKVMVKTVEAEPIDNITLFSIITVMSFILLAPVVLFTEGVKFTPGFMEAAGLDVQQVYIRSLLAALCFHAYQQVSYMILQKVSPVTHSVGNCVKRVVVITSSVLFFKTPVSPINALGTALALGGVFLYSRVKSIKPKPKAA